MADYSSLGTSFLPGDSQDPRRRRPQMQGDALRVLAMTLPGATGPGAIAPDMLLNAPGMAGLPGVGPQQSQGGLASIIAEAIIQQMTGGGAPGPLSGLQQQVAPQSSVLPPAMAPPAPLQSQGSLSSLVRAETTQPSGRISNAAPNVSGVPTPQLMGPAISTPMPSAPPPRVIAGDQPGPGEGVMPPSTTEAPGGAGEVPFDLGGVMRTLATLFERRGAKFNEGDGFSKF